MYGVSTKFKLLMEINIFLTIVDDYTRMTWIYLLKLKSDVCTVVSIFLQYVKIQFNKTVKVIRSDNDAEFVNDICSSLFGQLGIIHQRSSSYTPQQNGVAERKHRHILEVTRAIRFQANIPLKFWGHSVKASVYLINRLHSSVINMSSYEKLYNAKPSLGHLRVLGCLCYAKNLAETNKLQSRARTGVLVGYSEVQKGYILYDLTNKCYFVNRDVSFRESEFPFKEFNKDNPVFVHNIVPQMESHSADIPDS